MTVTTQARPHGACVSGLSRHGATRFTRTIVKLNVAQNLSTPREIVRQ